MKKIALSLIFLFLFLSAGCASKDYVRQQVEPLVDRISKLEAKKDCCDRISALEARKDCCDRAETAIRMAEEAAKKCEKSFELQQGK
jgi:hypothetical protein